MELRGAADAALSPPDLHDAPRGRVFDVGYNRGLVDRHTALHAVDKGLPLRFGRFFVEARPPLFYNLFLRFLS